MCCQNVLNRTTNGVLLHCNFREKYQLSFKNFVFDFSYNEMKIFTDYINKIDVAYWENEYCNSIYEKKIPIPIQQDNFILLFDREELEELRFLVGFTNQNKFLSTAEINYQVILN